MAIISFGDKETQLFFEDGKTSKGVAWAYLGRAALRKLDLLEYASQLKDLAAPPGNRLEPLAGNLLGFYSIRINSQWRIIFRWTEYGPTEVKICDYHN